MKRFNTTDVFRTAFLEQMKGVNTSIPGHVLSFNPATQRAQIQPGIQRVDINGAAFNIPPIIDVPVSFPGDDFILEHEITNGCEGSVYFSQRCIDSWKSSGGVAANPYGRFHDMQDAWFIPGIRSIPNVIQNFANNGIRIRNSSGSVYVWIKSDGTITASNGNAAVTINPDNSLSVGNSSGNMALSSGGTFNINGFQVDKNGNVQMASGATFTSGAGVRFDGHKHTAVQTGTGVSGGPTN